MKAGVFNAESRWLQRFISAATMDRQEAISDLLWFELQVLQQNPVSFSGAMKFHYVMKKYPDSTASIMKELDPDRFRRTLAAREELKNKSKQIEIESERATKIRSQRIGKTIEHYKKLYDHE